MMKSTAFARRDSLVAKGLMLLTSLYVLLAVAYLLATIPESFRADYLNHLMEIAAWDHARDYGKYLPFIFEFQSGHIIAVQKLYALLNFYVFNMSARFAIIFGIAVMVLYLALPCSLWLRRGLQLKTALACLLIALLVFSPHGFEVYGWADAISAHYPTAAGALLALFLWLRLLQAFETRPIPTERLVWHSFGMITATALTLLSNGSGWGLLPALLALTFGYYARKPNKSKWIKWSWLGLLPLIAIACWVLSKANAGQEVSGFEFSNSLAAHPFRPITHFLTAIAGPWAHFTIGWAWPAGILVLLTLLWMGLRAWRLGTSQSLVWLCLSLFGLCGCAMVSLTRFDIDHEVGFVAYRYTIYALPIYTGMLGLWVTTPNAPRATWSLARRATAAFAILLIGTIFVSSSLRARKAEVSQSVEVEAFTRATPDWNMKSAFRMASSYELPRLYLETLPLLKAAGRATLITDPFTPAGTVPPDLVAAMEKIKQGGLIDGATGHGCNAELANGRLYRIDMDERFLPRIRLYGTGFTRATGYFRDPKDCEADKLPVFAVDKQSRLLCVTHTSTLMHDDLPAVDRRDDIMQSRFAFDFSCPLPETLPENPPGTEAIFPVHVFGYNPKTGTLLQLGSATDAKTQVDADQQ